MRLQRVSQLFHRRFFRKPFFQEDFLIRFYFSFRHSDDRFCMRFRKCLAADAGSCKLRGFDGDSL